MEDCFVISVFGPTPKYRPKTKLPEWAEAPKGTAAVGVFEPSAMAEILKKLAEMKQRHMEAEKGKPQGGGWEG